MAAMRCPDWAKNVVKSDDGYYNKNRNQFFLITIPTLNNNLALHQI
jgi:hypothetical protein